MCVSPLFLDAAAFLLFFSALGGAAASSSFSASALGAARFLLAGRSTFWLLLAEQRCGSLRAVDRTYKF
jgi:hypothetical protein